MKYKIEKIEKSDDWNNFVKKQDLVNVLASWEWIEFEREMGFCTQVYKIDGEGVFAFRVVNAKKGKYLILKQNIFIDWENEDIVSLVIAFLKLECKKRGCKFFRISPPLLKSPNYEKLFRNYGFKEAPLYPIDGQLTTILDLDESLEDIQGSMRKNTRYLIRKAEKLGVEVTYTQDIEYLDDFKKIYDETVKRHRWNASEFDYIKSQYALFSKKGLCKMFVAKYRGKVLAVAIFTKFQNQVIYHHSGSVLTEVPVMYALMWEAIKYYKSLGLKEFNFFGVCEKDDKKHPWYGLSLFKRGFGGNERRFIYNYDYPVSRFYPVIKGIESLQRFRS